MADVPRIALLAALSAVLTSLPAMAQQAPGDTPAGIAVPADAPPYAFAADLVVAAPIIVDGAIRGVTPITGADAATVAPGHARLYIEADVIALISGPAALPARIGYLLDVPLDARGRTPRLRKLRVLLFARPVAGSASFIQLVRPDAQRLWTPGMDALTRRIATAALAADAPPAITGVGNAFHVPGALPGEGETQVFLTTVDQRPVSLSILTRPGEQRRWAVALSEIVDESAAAPARDTLLWYRLACGLPPQLPAASTASASPDDAGAAQDDYRFVLDSLGPCDRGPAVTP